MISVEDLRALLVPLVPDIPADPQVDLLSTGYIDSLTLVAVVALLEEHFNCEFEPSDLSASKFRSIHSLSSTMIEVLKRRPG